MQKRLTYSLTMALAMGLLAACAAPPAPATNATAAPAATVAQATEPAASAGKSTLKIMVWNNPATVESFKKINEAFQQKYPDITVDMSVDKTEDYWATTMPTRLTAGDVDVFLLQGFPNPVQDYMKGVDKPSWQTMVESGQMLDMTGQPFLNSYDKEALKAAGSFNGKVYTLPTGRYAFTGVFYNKDLFEKNGVKVPTTWDELVLACETFTKNNIGCMTSGAKDVWPLSVAGWGVQQAIYQDSEALQKGLWTNENRFNDEKSLIVWKRMQQLLGFMETGVTGIDNTAAPGRFASGKVAMYPAGTWDASNIELASKDLNYGYFPLPGSDNAEENKSLGGKFDASISIAGNAPNKDAALKWLEFFSQPENYTEYVNAVGIIPTQPNIQSTSKINAEIAPYLANFHNHISVLFVAPKGLGKYAAGPFSAANFKPYGDFDDAQALADQAQKDWETALASIK